MSDEKRPPDAPESLRDWLWRLKRFESSIFVREKVNGKLENVALCDLSPKRWADRVATWLETGILPVRVREDEEIKESK